MSGDDHGTTGERPACLDDPDSPCRLDLGSHGPREIHDHGTTGELDLPDGTVADIETVTVRQLVFAKSVPDDAWASVDPRFYVPIPDSMSPREAVNVLWDAAGTDHGRPE